MSWLIYILVFICLFVCWLLISPLVFEIDTREARSTICLVSIGKCSIFFEEEWWVEFQVFFYQRRIRLMDIKTNPPKKITKKKKQSTKSPQLKKVIRVLKSFKVKEWQLAADTGDVTWNARLYPFNFLPVCHSHLRINFADENYLYLKIINRPLKMIWAFLR